MKIGEHIITKDVKEAEEFFLEAVEKGSEGLICKSIDENSIYEAGKRGFKWIKVKRSYQAKMTDTVDLVAVGAHAGRGRRAGSYGALLMAAYNRERDIFETVCKLGSGFTDEQLAELPEKLSPHKIDHSHPRVNAKVKADFWFVPSMVLEIIGDEITLSPIHTCALGVLKENSGLAIRFPRLVNYRPDRTPEDATTVEEMIKIYRAQLKKLS